MSDNDYDYEENKKNDLDGLKVFIKAKFCFPLSEGEQKLFDNYDDDEKKMIYDFLNDSSCKTEIESLIKEIIDEEARKENNKAK